MATKFAWADLKENEEYKDVSKKMIANKKKNEKQITVFSELNNSLVGH